jgi:hypothetical protein
MPKKSKTQPVTTPNQPALFPAYRVDPLNIEERKQLRTFMATPLYAKMIRNAYCKKPSAFAAIASQWGEHSAQVSVNRLHQIQGWELFEAAFLGQAEESVHNTRKPLEENFQAP